MTKPEISIILPSWARALMEKDIVCKTDKEKISLAVDLSRQNIENKTGGPFGAAIFEYETGKLISVGINIVTTANCSVCHAEIVAIITAQKAAGSYDLSLNGGKYILASSTEPCAMCLGAVTWCGIRKIICAAKDADAREIGFDEGAKPADWENELAKRNIEVITGLMRDKAKRVLSDYTQIGGKIYNPGSI